MEGYRAKRVDKKNCLKEKHAETFSIEVQKKKKTRLYRVFFVHRSMTMLIHVPVINNIKNLLTSFQWQHPFERGFFRFNEMQYVYFNGM